MTSATKAIRILLVEDDANLSFVIRDNLEHRSFEVVSCDDGIKALALFQSQSFHICILDVMLPKQDGFHVAEKIRLINKQIPIIFLTAKSLKEDKIRAFEIGGDDYIVKPFNMEELLLRIQVFLKRSGSQKTIDIVEPMKLHSYTFHFQNLDLIHENETRKLTQRQAELLKMLCIHQGQVVKREDLLLSVWGNDDYFSGRSMDVFISKLRKYLKHDERIQIINYHGIGFKLTL